MKKTFTKISGNNLTQYTFILSMLGFLNLLSMFTRIEPQKSTPVLDQPLRFYTSKDTPFRKGIQQPTSIFNAIRYDDPSGLFNESYNEGEEVLPYLQNVTQDSIHILWETNQPIDSKVRYRKQGSPNWLEIHDSHRVRFHDIKIKGLDISTTYEYQVIRGEIDERLSITPTFTTAPEANQSFRVAVYGDSRTGYTQHAAVVDSIIDHNPDIILHTGDLVSNGEIKSEWYQEFFAPAANLIANKTIFPSIGNHDAVTIGRMWYYDYFSLPRNERWYAFTYGCGRFIVLDTTAAFFPGSWQYNWLVRELQSAMYIAADFQIIFFHHPPYTSGDHEGNRAVQYFLVPLFEQHGIDLVFSGHNHNYERSYKDGIYYIVTGGGGAPLYDFPNVDKNPYSQVRVKEYHHTILDFDCINKTLAYTAWDYTGKRIDGPINILGDVPRAFIPLVYKE